MNDIEKLLDQVRASGVDVWVAGPQSEAAIVELERALGIKMPPSYREFLARFGGLGLGDSFISGIIDNQPLVEGTGYLHWDTQHYRNDYAMPIHLLVVQPDGEAPYCLDSSTPGPDGEFPVVCYELHSGHMERMAGSFREWLVASLKGQAGGDD